MPNMYTFKTRLGLNLMNDKNDYDLNYRCFDRILSVPERILLEFFSDSLDKDRPKKLAQLFIEEFL